MEHAGREIDESISKNKIDKSISHVGLPNTTPVLEVTNSTVPSFNLVYPLFE